MAKKPSEKSRELYQYLKIHFSEEFATAITKYLSTDFTAECMLRYIRNTGKCSMEMIVDEMVTILSQGASGKIVVMGITAYDFDVNRSISMTSRELAHKIMEPNGILIVF